MAGFSSRLREKIESTRSNAATGHVTSNHQPKNIRGLTRLGISGVGAAASLSGGLLSGRNNSTGGASGEGGDGMAGNSDPLPISTSSLRTENRGQDASVSAVHRPPPRMGPAVGSSGVPTAAIGLDSSATLLGGSKIVPGWGAGGSNDPSNAPSGHLGGIKPRDHLTLRENKQRQGEQLHSHQASSLVKHIPWALHQPSSPRANLSQLSLSRRRWGDEEDDDSDEDFPQIGATYVASQGLDKDEIGSNICERHQGDVSVGGRFNLRDEHRGSRKITGWKEENGDDYSNNIRKKFNHRCHIGGRYSDHGNQAGHHDRLSYIYHNPHYVDAHGRRHHSGRGYQPRDNNHEQYYHGRRSEDRAGYFDNGSHCEKGHSDRSGQSPQGLYSRRYYNGLANNSRWDLAQRKHSQVSDCFDSGGEVSTSYVSDDCCNSGVSSTHGYLAGGGTGEDGASEKNGTRHCRLGSTYCSSSTKRGVDETRKRNEGRTGDPSSADIDNISNQLSRDPDPNRYQGLSDARFSKGGTSHFNRSVLHRHTVSNEATRMVLLRSSDPDHMTQTRDKPITLTAAVSSQVTQVESSAADTAPRLGHLEKNAVLGSSHPSQTRESASTTSDAHSSTLRPPTLAEDRTVQTIIPSAVAKHRIHFSLVSNPQTSPEQSGEETEQDRKDRAMEQQQNVLRQVAERRVAAAFSTKDETQLKKDCPKKWERGRKLSTDEENGEGAECRVKRPGHKEGQDVDGQEFIDNGKEKIYCKLEERNTLSQNRCRKEGHDHNWAECPKNPTSEAFTQKISVMKAKMKIEGPNPCRIEGHAHDWNICPNNPKSESFIRNNPCRIEGHKHDWNDCLDNPKSENYSRPNRKGRRGFKSLSSCTPRNRKHGHVSSGAEVDLSYVSKGSLNSESICKPDAKEVDGWTQKEDPRTNDINATAELTEGLSKPANENVELVQAKLFVPAPPPAVSAWMSGPPTTIRQGFSPHGTLHPSSPQNCSPAGTTSILETCNLVESKNQSLLKPAQSQLPESKSEQARSAPLEISQTQENPQGALFSGNNALFGNSQSTSVYDSWNPPPVVMPSCSVDPWKPNPFAPTTVVTSPLGKRFGSIWSDGAVSLVTSHPNSDARGGCCALQIDQTFFTEPMQSEAMKIPAAPRFSFGSLSTNDFIIKKEEESEKNYRAGIPSRTGISVVEILFHQDKKTAHALNFTDQSILHQIKSSSSITGKPKGRYGGTKDPGIKTDAVCKQIVSKPSIPIPLIQRYNKETTKTLATRKKHSSIGPDKRRPQKKLGISSELVNNSGRGRISRPRKHASEKMSGRKVSPLNDHGIMPGPASEETTR